MLVYDIETKVLNNNINPLTDEFRTISMYDIENNIYYFFTYKELDKVKALFNKHRVIIGHNNIEYDNIVLQRYSINFKYHILIDTLSIARKRELVLGIKYKSKNLSNLAKFFKLEHYKDDDFDYDILQKKEFTKEELLYIETYNINDVKVTYELFKHFYDFFEPFKEYLSKNNNDRMAWLTSSIASYEYKAVCNMCNIKEEYDDKISKSSYTGGYVTEPIKSYAQNVILFDFASLYPHCFAQCNLFSPKNDGWINTKIGMKGHYNTKQGRIEKLLMQLYKQRIEYKKIGDKREYVIKIIINSLYGAAANPVFKNLYNRTAASDCAAVSRYCIKKAIRMFTDFGYTCLYTDTDSVYIELKSNQNKKSVSIIAESIIKQLQKEFLFKEETFKLKIDDEIKHIYFFKKNGKYLKKMYIYVTNKDKIVIKGLPMIKSDGSKIGLKIFNKYMKDDLKKGNIVFDYETIKKYINYELGKNINIIARRFKVKDVSFYKNKSQLQSQISSVYGSGIHYLIVNKKFGVGKGKKYCTVKEFKREGLCINDLDLSKMWGELKFFVDVPVPVRVRKRMRMHVNQKSLFAWGGI